MTDRTPARTQHNARSKAVAEYRQTAVRLVRHLKTMMPPEEGKKLAKPRPDPAAPEYDRLLSKGQGVIDAFETLGLLIVRLIDKEREVLEQANPATAYPRIDEAELDRRFREELDRIAPRRD